MKVGDLVTRNINYQTEPREGVGIIVRIENRYNHSHGGFPRSRDIVYVLWSGQQPIPEDPKTLEKL